MIIGVVLGLFLSQAEGAQSVEPTARDWPLEAKAAFLLETADARYAAVISVDDHLKHIRGRFDEGRMALVRAMPGERDSWREASQVQSILTSPDPTEGGLPSRTRLGRTEMRDVVKLFEAARQYESVRAEATLRQAALLAMWGEHGETLPLLAAVDGMSNDPWLRYMAALLSGRSLEAMGRRHGVFRRIAMREQLR